MNYLVYGKAPGMKNFRPVSGKGFTNTLIHAEYFETKEQAVELKEYLRKHNPSFKWEVRKAK